MEDDLELTDAELDDLAEAGKLEVKHEDQDE